MRYEKKEAAIKRANMIQGQIIEIGIIKELPAE